LEINTTEYNYWEYFHTAAKIGTWKVQLFKCIRHYYRQLKYQTS